MQEGFEVETGSGDDGRRTCCPRAAMTSSLKMTMGVSRRSPSLFKSTKVQVTQEDEPNQRLS